MAYKKNIKTDIDNTDINNTKEVKKKKFGSEELIPCVSITPGELFVVGPKSKTLYTFANADDVVEIEFRDLDYMARAKDTMMFKPRYIVQDEDFIALHPVLDEVYSSLNSIQDLKNILKLAPSKMEKAINSLPVGAKESIKTIVASMIDDGTLDSIQRVKVLDSIFGTEMLLKLTSIE